MEHKCECTECKYAQKLGERMWRCEATEYDIDTYSCFEPRCDDTEKHAE
jgi:hypothetical protein